MTAEAPQFDLVRVADGHGWRKVFGEKVYQSPHVDVENVRCLTPARPDKPVPWTVVNRKAAVAIAPLLEDGRFVLVSQERVPVQRTLWEFPAGQIDVPVEEVTNELITHTALAELLQETGGELLPHGTLEPLGHFFPSQGFTQEHVYLVLARAVRIVAEPSPEGHEHFGTLLHVTPAELRQMIARNEITTALTLALYAKLEALGHLND